jgi:hypothetical protein
VKPPATTLTKRVRATCGNGIDSPGDTAAETAFLDTIKVLFNAVVSEAKSLFMTIDLKDFYLKSTLLRKEYAWENLAQIDLGQQLTNKSCTVTYTVGNCR